MKVLFAISNEEISESIVKKYQAEYKQIISSKNVYYFNAILKEIQKDKTYDRIVISEDLEAFTHSQYDQIDKFIFEKLDSISDEASNGRGKDIPIILICTDRRMKSDSILVKLFGIGVYNALIGPERSIEEVCSLLHRPRTKREAKEYYKIGSDDVNYMPESEDDVSEIEIQNILAHFKKLGKDEDKYVESFDNIAEQYNDKQLRVISKVLPLNVRAVLEEKCSKYQKVMSFNNMISDDLRRMNQKEGPTEKLLETKTGKEILKQPVVIPSSMGDVRKLTRNRREVNIELIDRRKEKREERKYIPPEEQHQITTSMASQRPDTRHVVSGGTYNNVNAEQEDDYTIGFEDVTPEDIIDSLQPTQPVEPVQPIEPVQPVQPVEPVQPIEPIQPVQPIEPVQPVQPIEPVQPVQPIEPVQPVQPIEPVQPTQPIDIMQTIQENGQVVPENTVEDTENTEQKPIKRGRGRPRKNPLPEEQPPRPKRGRGRPRKNPLPDEVESKPQENNIEPVQEVEPVKPAQPMIQPIENVDSIIKTLQPTQPIQPIEPIEPYESIDSVQPVEPVQPIEPIQPVEPVQPIEPIQSVEPVQPIEPIQPVEPVQPIEPVQPVESVQPIEPVQPVEPVQPIEPIQPVEPVQPIEPIQPVEPVQPIEPIQPVEPVQPVEPIQDVNSIGSSSIKQPIKIVDEFANNEPKSTYDSAKAYGKLDDFGDSEHNNYAYTGVSNNKKRNEYTNTIDITSLLTSDKKLVTFLGTSKNGTSFIVNNLAELASSMGIKTAILDATTNRNSYYIYTKNEESLREIALGCFDSLVNKQPAGIMVNKNLTVYTSLPGDDEKVEMVDEVLETLVKNYSLVLIDTDFNTPIGYFKQAQEIYLVQSLDILTIQPLTAFLRKLKSKNALDERKIRIIINKAVKVRGIQEKTIIGGMAYYTDPAMSYMSELFDRNTVKYITIPFEDDTYIRYLENIINCEISLKGYSKVFMQSLKELANMVYPLVPGGGGMNQPYRPPSAFGPGNRGGGDFSQSMNNTLNQMKRNY